MHLKQHIQQEQKVRPYSARQTEKQNVGGPKLPSCCYTLTLRTDMAHVVNVSDL